MDLPDETETGYRHIEIFTEHFPTIGVSSINTKNALTERFSKRKRSGKARLMFYHLQASLPFFHSFIGSNKSPKSFSSEYQSAEFGEKRSGK